MARKTSTKPKDPKTTGEPVKDETLETVLKAFNTSWEYTSSSWHDRWQDNYKLYNNQRVKRGYLGISDTFVPMTFSTVETLTSALFGTKPKFAYLPPANKASQNTDILNGLVDYYWDKDQWSIKVINTGRGGMREGTAVDYFCWDIDHPRLINVPIRDFFIDSNAYELDERTTQYCGRRYLTTWDELDSYEIVDMESLDENGDPTGDLVKKYKNLDKLKGDSKSEAPKGSGGNQEQTTDKQEKDMFYGSTMNNPENNQIEVIEYWTVDKVISVANRAVVIEDSENYFKTQDRAKQLADGKKENEIHAQGLLPFAAFRDYVDGSLFYAKGEVDIIADQQEDLNDFSNQNKDAISFNLNQMYTLDPKYSHMIEEVENLPGAVYPFEAGTLMPIQKGTIPPEAFNERTNIKNEIRETTASNEVIKGGGESAGSKATATEIQAQVAGAGQRINLKVTQVENEYFHRVAKIVFRMVQLFVSEPMMIRILGKDGARWEEFDPADFDGQYEPRVQLDITMQNHKQQQAAEAKEMLAAFLNDPDVNQQELKKLVLSRSFDLDPDEVEMLMSVPPQAPMGADPMAAMMGDPNAQMGGMPQDPNAMMPPMVDPSMAMPPEAMPEDVEPAPEPIIDPETGIAYDPETGMPIEEGMPV